MNCQNGATAVEFALVAPMLFGLIIGGLSTGRVFGRRLARCSRTGGALLFSEFDPMQHCDSSPDICQKCLLWNEHADIHGIDPVMRVQLSAIITDFSVPLTATACFP
jgi:hypothetical protein